MLGAKLLYITIETAGAIQKNAEPVCRYGYTTILKLPKEGMQRFAKISQTPSQSFLAQVSRVQTHRHFKQVLCQLYQQELLSRPHISRCLSASDFSCLFVRNSWSICSP